MTTITFRDWTLKVDYEVTYNGITSKKTLF